jgi:hypothetical protein
MQATFRMFLGLAIVLAAVVAVANAEEKPAKAVTLKGEIACAKCVFKVDGIKKCTTAIKVKDGDKETVYLLIDKGNKEEYHKEVCTKKKKGSVTGVVSKKGDQNFITPAKDGVKFD